MEVFMRIFERANIIRSFSPIEIYIDNKLEWSDDIDISNLDDEEGYRIVRENKNQYKAVLSRHDLIKSISFEIVHQHHSIVRIETGKED